MNVSSIIVQSIDNLHTALKDLIETQFQPTVAIAFSSPEFPFQKAVEIFKENKIELIGCTSSGELHDNAILSGSFTVLLMDIAPHYFKIVQFDHQDIRAFSSGLKLKEIAFNTFSNPGLILFISGVRVMGDGPVKGIREKLEREIPIYGGLAGDNLQHDSTHVFSNAGVSDFGISALIVDTYHIQLKGLAVSGWKPLGKTHLITRADKNVIYEIDNQPALDLFLNYFGNIEYKPSTTDGFFSIPGQYPLKILQDDGTSYLRSLLIYDTENRALLAAGEIHSGANFKFCPPPDFNVVTETISHFKDFSKKVLHPEALIMVSCKGRHISFGPMLEDEVKSIYDIWGVPMVGFLSNGEIGNSSLNGRCEFHNVSCSLVGLKEIVK